MSLKLKVFLALALIGGALGGTAWGLVQFWDAAGDAREAVVRNEWKQEKLDLIAARQQAERDAAEARKNAESKKQENEQRGEQVIEKSRNVDPDWSNTPMPAELYESARKN